MPTNLATSSESAKPLPTGFKLGIILFHQGFGGGNGKPKPTIMMEYAVSDDDQPRWKFPQHDFPIGTTSAVLFMKKVLGSAPYQLNLNHVRLIDYMLAHTEEEYPKHIAVKKGVKTFETSWVLAEYHNLTSPDQCPDNPHMKWFLQKDIPDSIQEFKIKPFTQALEAFEPTFKRYCY